jgi:cell division septation protein DedD
MRRAEGREKSSVLFLGKWIIILSLILTSSLSFVLGYFVGKSMNPGNTSQMQPVPAPIPYEQPPAAPSGQASYPEQLVKDEDLQKPFQPAEVDSSLEKYPSGNRENPKDEPASSQKNTAVSSGSNQKQKQEKASGTSQGKKTVEPAKAAPKTMTYTVQVGAFKNEADALALKTKFEKKGYKTQVINTQEKNREKLFKVMVGAFSVRKDAELLALKLKKTEGLKTFVTFHKNAEGIR